MTELVKRTYNLDTELQNVNITQFIEILRSKNIQVNQVHSLLTIEFDSRYLLDVDLALDEARFTEIWYIYKDAATNEIVNITNLKSDKDLKTLQVTEEILESNKSYEDIYNFLKK